MPGALPLHDPLALWQSAPLHRRRGGGRKGLRPTAPNATACPHGGKKGAARGAEIATHELWVDPAAGAYGHGAQGRGGGWAGLRQVVCVRTTHEALQAGLAAISEDHHYLTRLAADKPPGDPDALPTLARSHWEIENRLHHTKDRALAEDADRTRGGATIMARLRSLAVGMLRYIPGAGAPPKQIRVSADRGIVLRPLKRNRLPRIQG